MKRTKNKKRVARKKLSDQESVEAVLEGRESTVGKICERDRF